MYGETKNSMQCSDFDLLLADAIDGQLTGEQLSRFEQHKTSCPACSAMFADAKAGLNWLSELNEVEPPRNLMHNILVATSGVPEQISVPANEVSVHQPRTRRLRDTLTHIFAPVFTPRFAMSAAMAFFSVTMALNVGGIKLKDLQHFDLTRTYRVTEARVTKYYENIRLVYEIESRVNELRRAADSNDGERKEKQQKQNGPDGTTKTNDSEPERHEQNYSRQSTNELVEASLVENGIIARQRRLS